MRVALTKGSLIIPPTYFAVQHALNLADRHEFRFFTMAANIGDADIARRITIEDVSEAFPVPISRMSWQRRERALPLLFARTASRIRDYEPDVIHQHFANWATPAVRASGADGIPLVLTVHGADVYVPLTPSSERNMFGRPLLRWHQRSIQAAFDASSRILAVSEYLAGAAVEAGADPKKVVVHYQGVDTDVYRPVEEPLPQTPRIVAVSALKEAKGTRDLLQASIALARSHEHELVLVGDGPLRPVAEAAAAEHAHIRLTGQLDRAGVHREYSRATVFALPTKRDGRWREAAGLVTLEAQASGVPVVVYDSGGASEMLSDGETGLLVREGDVPALTDALAQILTLGATERLRLGRAAREWVVAERNLAGSAAELEAHYLEVTR